MNAPVLTPRRFTRAEFDRIAQSGGFGDLRVELVRGWIVEMSPQHIPHLRLKTDLATALTQSVQSLGLAWRVDTEGSVALGPDFEPMPDIVVWDPTGVPADLDGPIPGSAVKLVVEVGSTTLARDLGEMLEEYARAGLAEYWVADVKGRMVLRHSGPEGDGYRRREVSRLGLDPLVSLTIPGLIAPWPGAEG